MNWLNRLTIFTKLELFFLFELRFHKCCLIIFVLFFIFSLPPAQLKHAVEKRHIDYDYAHGTSDNCTERYDSCKDSVWNAGFLLEAYQNVSE